MCGPILRPGEEPPVDERRRNEDSSGEETHVPATVPGSSPLSSDESDLSEDDFVIVDGSSLVDNDDNPNADGADSAVVHHDPNDDRANLDDDEEDDDDDGGSESDDDDDGGSESDNDDDDDDDDDGGSESDNDDDDDDDDGVVVPGGNPANLTDEQKANYIFFQDDNGNPINHPDYGSQHGDNDAGWGTATSGIDKLNDAVDAVDDLLTLGVGIDGICEEAPDEIDKDFFSRKSTEREKQVENNDDLKTSVGNFKGVNYSNAIMGGVKALSGGAGMIAHGHRASNLWRRDKLKHGQETTSSISNAFKMVAGATQLGAGVANLQNVYEENPEKTDVDNRTFASNLCSSISTFCAFGGGLTDTIGAGVAAKRYSKIKGLKDSITKIPSRNYSGNPDDRKRINNKAEAFNMAANAAKSKQDESFFNAVTSGVSAFGALCSFGASLAPFIGSDAASVRLGSSIVGTVGGIFSSIGKGVSLGVGLSGKYKKNAEEDRNKYVNDYLTRKAQSIQTKAADGKNGVAINNLDLEDAKRIALKKLGLYQGNVISGNGAAVQIDNNMRKSIYNSLAMKRATKLYNISDAREKTETLAKLELGENATIEDIADRLGYEE